ncbi:uncharacterized protein MONBRDRAFT_26342 [Monosiga brevicollis MX1]|uniref:Uncharacterized protein n=1 Tax=Monosiga brevicollis TaxID=81824 RepID=A9V233_MONBE|nr:uncharacterized protein MONBRDRAFT_26342 [Monosiga brevicollis MX1]EDQ88183.1 predicted protein [Monosiga brevicollis MX1]|eukprot:XP_001746776.1 hypothetical protein [Monosiga brevicollis MX1]
MQATQPARPGPGGVLGPNYVPTAREQEVLSNCKRASLTRGVVGAGLGAALAHVVMMRRQPRPTNLTLAAWYTGLGAFGFYAGVASYQTQCIRQILELSDSPMADELRAFMNAAEHAPGRHASPGATSTPAPTYSTMPQSGYGSASQQLEREQPAQAAPPARYQYPYRQQQQQQQQPVPPQPTETLYSDENDWAERAPQAHAVVSNNTTNGAPAAPASPYTALREQQRSQWATPASASQPSQQPNPYARAPPPAASPYHQPQHPEQSQPDQYWGGAQSPAQPPASNYGDLHQDPSQPRPTSPLDRQRLTPRFTKYGDPIDE